MSFFNTKCISTCITFLTNPLQTCLLTPYFLQNVLAHGSHEKFQKNILKHVYTHLSFLKHISMCITFFTKKKFQTISLIPYFLQNIKAHGSQIFKRLSSNMITHSSIYPKCFNTWIIYFFKIKSSNMLTHTIYCPKCISTLITYFQKKIIKHVQTQIYFSKMY